MDIVLIVMGVGCVAFMAGVSIGEYRTEFPTDEEMFRRLVASRSRSRIEKEVEAALQNELNRQTARS